MAEDEAARRRPWHSVYVVLGQELPFDLVFEDLRPQVLQTCLDVLGRSFLRSWPGGPQEMEDALRRGVEESGAGPVAHGLRRSQAQELSGRLAPFVATQVCVNRAAAEAVRETAPARTRSEPEAQNEEIEVRSQDIEIAEGSVVRIEEDLDRAKELQGSHWVEAMKPSLGEVATVVALRGSLADVMCPKAQRSQTWSLSCLQPDASEALFCLDLHEHPLLWCSFPNCHTCDGDCDRRRIWEAYRCAKCDFDVCRECAKSYGASGASGASGACGLVRSRHHLMPLGRAVLPRGLRSSRRSCAGDLRPGGCRTVDRDAPAVGACCPLGKFFICDACRNCEGEITEETRRRDVEDVTRIGCLRSLSLHPSEIFALAEHGVFAELAKLTTPAVRNFVLDLGDWLAVQPKEAAGQVLVERDGVWSEGHVCSRHPQSQEDEAECWVAVQATFCEEETLLKVPTSRIRPAFASNAAWRPDRKLREELDEELKKGCQASETSVRRLLQQGADVLDIRGSDPEAGLLVSALRYGCRAPVLEALLLSWCPVAAKDLQAFWSANGGAPLLGEPRLAMLLAERGSPWAEMCGNACAEMAEVAAKAQLQLEELAKEREEARAQSEESSSDSVACAACAQPIGEDKDASGTGEDFCAAVLDELRQEKEREDREEKDDERDEKPEQEENQEEKEEDAEDAEDADEKEQQEDAEDAEAKDAEAKAAKEVEAEAKEAEAKRRAKAAKLALDAESKMVEAKAAAEACRRMARRTWPKGDWRVLMHRFQVELFAPVLEAAPGLELNGRFGIWLGALLQAGCEASERQVENLARRVSLALSEAGAALRDTMMFVEKLFEALPVHASAGIVAALKRHGVEARLLRIGQVGAVSDGATLRPLRESAQRIMQLEHWKAAECAENPAVADLVGRLSEPGVLDDVAELLRSQACTPYELSLHAFPARLLPLLSSSEWPWPPTSLSPETLEAIVPALQWLLGLCETLPVAAADGTVSGVDCLVRPLELTLESCSSSKTLFVEPLLPLRDLERFLLQTSTPEDEYVAWCRGLVGQRLAERDVSSSRGSAWRTANVKSFDIMANLPVHTLLYDDGEEAMLLLHLREVLSLPKKEESLRGVVPEMEDSNPGQHVSQERIHKVVVQLPMVQAGEIPFEMVWADLLEGGEAVLQASPDGTWTALGWKDRSEMQEALKANLEADGQGTLARGMTLEQANLLLERMDELGDALSVAADPTDLQPKKEGPICRRVQLLSRTVGVAVWEYADGLDVVDQTGRFLPKVPTSQILPPARRARHTPGRSLPLELSVLGLSGNSTVGGFEWQFAGDQGWCRYDAAASRLLEAARERNEDTVTVRSGSNRYLVDIRAGTQTNVSHAGRRVRRVRRLAGGPRNAVALERNFSAVDRGPVNDFEQKVLERKLGEEHFRQEDVPCDSLVELGHGVAVPRLRVDFFCVEASEEVLPLECTVLQALLWRSDWQPSSPSAPVDQRLRYVLRQDASRPMQEQTAFPNLRRDHTGVQAAGLAGAEGESATLLALLRRLHRFAGDRPICWENDQLNRKLAHQLAQPLLTAGGVVPPWVKALPLTYPFLFERKLKEQLLHCMGFGISHAVLWLQRRCVEARFGEQLRLARERLARTGNDAELWEIHEQAAADESVFVGAGRSEMARLPGRGRCNLLEIAERVIQLTYNSRALLEVVFDDETGFGDGVTQSFYTDVAAELCSDTVNLWAEHLPHSRVQHQGRTFLHSRRGLFPQPHVPGSPQSAAACKRFRFLGRLMAKALRDGFIVPLPLCPRFFQAVLGTDLPLEALPSPGDGWVGEFLGAAARFAWDRRCGACPEQRGWARKYLEVAGDAGEMTFHEYSQHCFFLETGTSGMEICEGGAERVLSAENLDDFVECAAQWWLRDGITPQVEAYRQGVEDVCDSAAIWAFEAEELQELMCGTAAPDWTEKELKQHLKFRGGYNAGSPAVQLLIQELLRMTSTKRSQFLEFVTACPRLPHGGLEAAEIAVVAAQPKGSLPRAHTCTNELQLPSYSSLEELSVKLLEAMENARGMYE